ncbi:hypothetical protein PPYR_07899 [Photinus pyralis]|uniref:Cytochrome P450 n=2 Tax=Photinus pyralis TaxID=7054 RepID=A0A5N4ART9_PHOPY|nr:hypothetical protein PPYR_07899 [Photinus pyralis]
MEQVEGERNVMEIREICKRLLCDITTTYIFGVNCDAINNPDSEMYSMAEKSMTFKAARGLVAEFFPKLLKWKGTKMYSEDVRQFFASITRQSIKMHLENNLNSSTVINMLLERYKIEKSRIDDLDGIVLEDIMAHALILVFSGYETVNNTLAALIYELTMHADVQKQLYEEIVKTVNDHDVSYDDIISIGYLDHVVNETIRLHSTNAIIDRRTMKNYVIKAENPDE